MPQPKNCDEKCTNYDYCKDTDVFEAFVIPDSECTDRHEADDDE